MKVHTLKFTQKVPMSIEQAWDFFSSPKNLAVITPEKMGFNITSKYEIEKMYPGMLITYNVSPMLGIKLNWCTEITHVKDLSYFVDEQRFGPYSMWHHQHHFKTIDGGVEMVDIIDYAIPLGVLGDIANSLFVAKEIQQIFDYREKKIELLFGKM